MNNPIIPIIPEKGNTFYDLAQQLYEEGRHNFAEQSEEIKYQLEKVADPKKPLELNSFVQLNDLEKLASLENIPDAINLIQGGRYSPKRTDQRTTQQNLTDMMYFIQNLQTKDLFKNPVLAAFTNHDSQFNHLVVTRKPEFFNDDVYKEIAENMKTDSEVYILYSANTNNGQNGQPNVAFAQVEKENEKIRVTFRPFAMLYTKPEENYKPPEEPPSVSAKIYLDREKEQELQAPKPEESYQRPPGNPLMKSKMYKTNN